MSLSPEDQLRLLIDNVVDYAMFALDTEGHVTTWNPGAERIKGYTATEIIGRHFSLFYPPEDVAAGKPQRGLAIATADGRYRDEGWRVRKDGTLFWADVTITALRGPRGELSGFGKVTRDLTERKRAEDALRHSEERQRLMVDQVVDYAIFMLDPDGLVASWNEGARKLKQYSADEIIGRHFSTFYPADDVVAGKPKQELEEAVRVGRVEDEGWRVRRDGTRFWANVVMTALRDPTGELRGFAKVTRDLTERKRNEDALRAVLERERTAARQLREADSAKQDLVAIVAHDLRAPIGVLHGTADMLIRDWDRLGDADRLRMLQMMASSSERLSTLVDDVLDVARLEAGQLRYELEVVDATAVVRRAAGDVDPGQTRVTVQSPDDPVLVRVDERRLWQIALNLLSNALKFSAPTEPVEVSVVAADGAATIAVTDHGIGVPVEEQPKLFQRFSRIPRLNGPATAAGTGLGLYIARSLVEALGGRIGVRSAEGEGATFWITLPLEPAAD